MKKVFACVDESALNMAVCDYSIYVAKKLNLELVFINVIETSDLGENFYGLAAGGIVLGEKDMVLSPYEKLEFQDSQKDIQKSEVLLEKCVDKAKEKGINADKILRDGDFIDVIAEYKDEAAVFVLGIKGTNSEDVGFNATMLIKEMKIPALLVNKDFSEINSVLVAFDGSEMALKTVEFVKNSKLLMDSKKYIIHVNTDNDEAQKTLDIARDILGDKNAEFVAINGEIPGDEIIKYRRENNLDLIATGAFSKGFFKKLILGSVSQDIMQNALVPILVFA